MIIIVTLKDGSMLKWDYGLHVAIDKMVEAIKENCDWSTIVIHIANSFEASPNPERLTKT